MPVRCFQCKAPLFGRGTGSCHAKATGHVWEPGYYCHICERTFSSYGACLRHGKTCRSSASRTPSPSAVDAGVPITSAEPSPICEKKTPISEILSCPVCGEHFGIVETLDQHRREHNAVGQTPLPVQPKSASIKFACSTCKLEFTSNLALTHHTASASPCRTCQACIPHDMMTLQDHYRMSRKHPMPCPWCNLGFDSFDELAPHYSTCMPGAVKLKDEHAPERIDDVSTASGSELASNDITEPVDTTRPSVEPAAPQPQYSASSHPVKDPPSATDHQHSDVLGDAIEEGARHAEVPSGDPLPTPSATAYPGLSAAFLDVLRAPLPSDTNHLHCSAGVPVPGDGAIEYDGFTDDADRSSVIAKAALDLISQRYGGGAAERVLRAMQELGGAIAEERGEREGVESLLRGTSKLEVPETPLIEVAESCSSPSSIVQRFVATQRAALEAEVAKRSTPQNVKPSDAQPEATTSSARKADRARRPEADNPPKRPAATGAQSWHCRSCKNDPCVDPIATVCGHIFCRECFIRELQTHGACPVCGKMFLLRLDVGVRP